MSTRTTTANPDSLLECATVLVVDDERGPRESLRMILSAEHRVLVASSGAEALEILRTTPVAVATVDLNMPGMRGDELMRTIREQHPHVEVIIITGFGSVDTAVEGIRYGVCDYLAKPFDVVQVTASVSRALKRHHCWKRLVGFLEGVGSLLGKNTGAQEMLVELDGNRGLQRRLRALLAEPVLDPAAARTSLAGDAAVEFLEVLAETIESRDEFMRGHARRTAFYASLLGERVGVGATELASLRLAAFLHDLGKVGVSLEVIQSREELGRHERESIECHASIGERLIRPLGFSSSVASAIRHHHERWDGAGYPDGLRGEAIPLSSRIVAVADAFDAMTCVRPYRGAMDETQAIAELRKHAGSQFEPRLVEQFVEMMSEGGFELAAAQAPRVTPSPAS
jgi:putative two-component system response regulator